jgi:hypothetical protein
MTGRSGRDGVSRGRQIEALVTVFRAIDADAIMVVEAPDISRRHDGETALKISRDHAGHPRPFGAVWFPEPDAAGAHAAL